MFKGIDQFLGSASTTSSFSSTPAKENCGDDDSTSSAANKRIRDETGALDSLRRSSGSQEVETAARSDDDDEEPSLKRSRLEENESEIQRGLSILVKAATERTCLINENTENNTQAYDEKDAKFVGLRRPLKMSSTGVIGNQVYRAAKRAEADAAMRELDIKSKCALLYDEDACVEYVRENKTLIVQIAFWYFLHAHQSENCKIKSVLVSGQNQKDNNIVIVKDKETMRLTGSKGILLDLDGDQRTRKTTDSFKFRVKGVKTKTMESMLGERLDDDDDTKDDEGDLPPTERCRLDLSKAEGSYIFSTLRRYNPSKLLYYAGGTFWQKKYAKGKANNNKYRWCEIVGWDEDPAAKKTSRHLGIQSVFYMPSSFGSLAVKILDTFKGLLASNARSRKNMDEWRERIINPKNDFPVAYNHFFEPIDRCLDMLLSISKNCSFTNNTVEIYRRKFRRYCLFSFVMYLINSGENASAVTPLPFNFFNFFAYMFSHGPKMSSSGYMATMSFLYQRVFQPLGSAAPSKSVKSVLDIDTAILRGGKAAVRDFGSPVKSSIHTRTLVTYLAYTETIIRTLVRLSSKTRDCNVRLKERVALSIERWCDSLLFVFFTFVLFHRFSGVKRVSLQDALKLVLGKTHVHANKARATRLVKMADSGNLFTASETVTQFKRVINVKDDDKEARTAGLTVSYPHLLGLPYSIQAMLGLPLSHLNPLVCNADTAHHRHDTYKSSFSQQQQPQKLKLFGLNTTGVPPPPSAADEQPDAAIGHICMFENLVSDLVDRHHGEGTFDNIVSVTLKFMENHDPYDKETGRLGSYLVADEEILPDDDEIRRPPPPSACTMGINRDVKRYFMASPMRLVFIVTDDSEGNERYLSIGDLALLAIWVKLRVLGIDECSVAINHSNYRWLGKELCRHLLLNDFANFGILGDAKIINKMDCNTNTMHRDGKYVPSVKEQLDFAKYTSLDDRKNAAIFHGSNNVRTRTHLGRVTSTSWAVSALKTLTKGDKDMFSKLVLNLDVCCLGHTNSANFFPYFSSNFDSNENELGLWGFVKRTSDRAATERCIESGEVASLTLHLGEEIPELDAVAKRRLVTQTASSTSRRANVVRKKIREHEMERIVVSNDKDGRNVAISSSATTGRLKDLWRFCSSTNGNPDEVLLRGSNLSAVCPFTGYLMPVVPDTLVRYHFSNPSNSFKLRLQLMNSTANDNADASNNNATDIDQTRVKDMSIACTKKRIEERAVVTLDTSITKYNKFGLARDEKNIERLIESDRQCRIAAGIKKVLNRPGTHRTVDTEDTDSILNHINRLAFTF